MSIKTYNILVTFKTMISYLLKNKELLPKKFQFKYLIIPQALKDHELAKIIHNYDGLVCGDDEVNKKVLKNAKNLKVISKWGTGIDSIDTNLCKKLNIKVFNTPGAFTESVAELALSYILIFSREVFYIHNEIKKKRWPKITGSLLKEKKLGIIGLGKIGTKLASYASKMKMEVFYNDIKKKNNQYKKCSLDKIFKISDFICICCDLNKSSKHLINLPKLKKMKRTVSLINVSRGSIIKEMDLIVALRHKYIKNVALDVFENEPLDKKSKLRNFKNILFSSHNAFNTYENVKKVNINTLKNLSKVLK